MSHERFFAFLGFCPDADFSRRRDTRWRECGICEYEVDLGSRQEGLFSRINVGDIVILKKRQIFGKTMRLYGHGQVIGVDTGPLGRRRLSVSWHKQISVIEVPLLACNSTVNLREVSSVAATMPSAFWEWLGVASPYSAQF